MIYKTLYYKGNPSAEYQYRKGVWYKRKRGSNSQWYPLDSNGQKLLQGEYGSRPMVFFYEPTFLLVAAAGLAVGGWYFYTKVWKQRSGLSKG